MGAGASFKKKKKAYEPLTPPSTPGSHLGDDSGNMVEAFDQPQTPTSSPSPSASRAETKKQAKLLKQKALIFESLEQRDMDTFRYLVEIRANLLVERDEEQCFGRMTPLHYVCHPEYGGGGDELVNAVLEGLGHEGTREAVQKKTAGGLLHGGTPVHWACRFDDRAPGVAEKILLWCNDGEAAKQALLATDALKRTPLDYADGYGFTELADALREIMADADNKPKKGQKKGAPRVSSSEAQKKADATSDTAK